MNYHSDQEDLDKDKGDIANQIEENMVGIPKEEIGKQLK